MCIVYVILIQNRENLHGEQKENQMLLLRERSKDHWVGAVAATLFLLTIFATPLRAQEEPADLNGIWQALGTAHWDLEGHAARPGPIVELGALGAVPAGLGVVLGGKIPYRPEAARQRDENRENWLERDPAVKCYLPGVPRATYMPFPFQIVQDTDFIIIAYEFAHATRVVHMSSPDSDIPFDAWMGHSRGHWEEETLVVEVTRQLPDTWFDSSGNFHSGALHIVERYTPISPDALLYEARIEDPEVFTEPWTIRLPLYRRLDENIELLEFKCIEFVEELMYGHLSRGADLTDEEDSSEERR